MRTVIQRVKEARVEVNGVTSGRIRDGLLVLLGIAKGDTTDDADYLLEKIVTLRVFRDDDGKMNRSLVEAGGSLLIVSQFTLYGDVRKGRRPSFDAAAPPAQAEELYSYFVAGARARSIPTETGVFQAMMDVHLINDGPVTLICESPVRTRN